MVIEKEEKGAMTRGFKICFGIKRKNSADGRLFNQDDRDSQSTEIVFSGHDVLHMWGKRYLILQSLLKL